MYRPTHRCIAIAIRLAHERHCLCLLASPLLRQPVRRLPLRYERRSARRYCSLCVVSAGSFETKREQPPILFAGSRRKRTVRHMARIRPISLLRTPTARNVSRRFRKQSHSTSGSSEHCHDPVRSISAERGEARDDIGLTQWMLPALQRAIGRHLLGILGAGYHRHTTEAAALCQLRRLHRSQHPGQSMAAPRAGTSTRKTTGRASLHRTAPRCENRHSPVNSSRSGQQEGRGL